MATGKIADSDEVRNVRPRTGDWRGLKDLWVAVIGVMLISSVVGPELINSGKGNLLCVWAVVFAAFLPLAGVLGLMPRNFFLVCLWAVSLVLLFENSLITRFIKITDASPETIWIREVLATGRWDAGPSPLHSMLGATVNPAIDMLVTGLSTTSYYKWVAPVVASSIPVILFSVFRRWGGEYVALLAAFVFLSQFTYFAWAGETAKQASAGVCFALALLLIGRLKAPSIGDLVSIVAIMWGLVVSHYGTDYGLVLAFVGAILAHYTFLRGQGRLSSEIPGAFLVFYAIFGGWALWADGGVVLKTLVGYVRFALDNLSSGVNVRAFAPWATTFHLGSFHPTLTMLAGVYVSLVVLSVVGIWNEFSPRSVLALSPEIRGISVLLFAPLLALPFGRMAELDFWRMIYTSMFVAAPFAVIGGVQLWRLVLGGQGCGTVRIWYVAAGVFVSAFLLLNSGVVSELFQDLPGAAVGIASLRIQLVGTLEQKEYFYRVYTTDQDVASAVWLDSKRDPRRMILADVVARWSSLVPYGGVPESSISALRGGGPPRSGDYVYLRFFNLLEGFVEESALPLKLDSLRGMIWLTDRSLIYTAGLSRIYL